MTDTCIFCKKAIKKNLLCNEHSKLFAEQYSFLIKKNLNTKSIKSYYHNLRYSIMKSGMLNIIIELSIRLIALGYLNFKKTSNTTLLDKAVFEAKTIFYNKVNFQQDIIKNVDEFKNGSINDFNVREKWPTNFAACDGHKLRSLGEAFIDNWLFFHDFKHSYEKKVFYDSVNFFLSDFYLDKEKVYIEYCGKKDKEYLIKKKAQQKLYESLNLKVIYVDYNDLKTFDDFFEEKLRKLL